jgi:D-alanine-D-alanine ligase-like ATP-grasp enzyme
MNELSETLLREKGLTFPDIIVKPIRGRGSQGVARVQTFDAMIQHITDLFESGLYGDKVMIEEYLPGDEVTISVLPPGTYYNPVTKLEFVKESYWTFNPVIRTGHVDGVAPYNGVVAVTKNSRALLDEELTTEMQTVCEHCERAAAICSARAIIRIDCRFDRNGKGKLFDLNMKPNMTGSGRIGRDDQDSLVAIACRGTASIGMWNYAYLLYNLLLQSKFI